MRTEVRHGGLVATLFQPPGPGLHPAVVVLGGSDGGLWELPAALLASHGFSALALAYFGLDPLPPELVEIPLKYFEAALRWLMQQEGINPQAVAVMGWSRWGELALLLGAILPALRALWCMCRAGCCGRASRWRRSPYGTARRVGPCRPAAAVRCLSP
jgi:dienelactone hydrolase